jgi:hypothetical protein
VLAPNAELRSLVLPQAPTAQAQTFAEAAYTAGCRAEPGHEQSGGLFVPGEEPGLWPGAACRAETVQARPHRISWARLLGRVLDIDMQHCPNCGAGAMKIIAAILERQPIGKFPSHLGLDSQPPSRGRVREVG